MTTKKELLKTLSDLLYDPSLETYYEQAGGPIQGRLKFLTLSGLMMHLDVEDLYMLMLHRGFDFDAEDMATCAESIRIAVMRVKAEAKTRTL